MDSPAIRCQHEEACQGAARLASMKRRSLRYIRPKVHMTPHVMRHGCTKIVVMCFEMLHYDSFCFDIPWQTFSPPQLSRDIEYQLVGDECQWCLHPAFPDLKDLYQSDPFGCYNSFALL